MAADYIFLYRSLCEHLIQNYRDRLVKYIEKNETFEKFKDCIDEVHRFNEEDAFVTGFRLGARLIIESFCEDDGFFTDIDA